MASFKLKPCPFCGGKPAIRHKYQGTSTIVSSFVKCEQCGIATKDVKISPAYSSDVKAVNVWNDRRLAQIDEYIIEVNYLNPSQS